MTESILKYPDPRLRQKSESLEKITDDDRARVFRMLKLLAEEGGIGLAAPQIGWMVRLFVMNVHPEHDPLHSIAIINPVITSTSDRQWSMVEGCLSLPGIEGSVKRPWSVQFRGQNLEGVESAFELEGLPARCMLHEFDHLTGTLFVDHLSTAKKHAIKGKLRKLENGG